MVKMPEKWLNGMETIRRRYGDGIRIVLLFKREIKVNKETVD